jgi:hypothetical protein
MCVAELLFPDNGGRSWPRQPITTCANWRGTAAFPFGNCNVNSSVASDAPQVWLNERRIVAAQELLLSEMPVKVVALELGLKQTSHFCRKFKALNRTTPSAVVSSQTLELPDVARG